MIRSSSILLCFILHLMIIAYAAVEAFTADLVRPWDELSLTKRRQSASFIRLYVSELEKSKSGTNSNNNKNNNKHSNEDDNGDGEDTKARNEEILEAKRDELEESMVLEEPEIPGSSSHVLSSGATVAAAAAASAKETSVPGHQDHNQHKIPTSVTATSHNSLVQHSIAPKSPSILTSAPPATVRSSLKDLMIMTRPSNLPGVVLFHMLGTHLVSKSLQVPFWNLCLSPGMLVTLLALLLTSSTSMVVNDYYDYKLDVDTNKLFKPLSSQKIPLLVVKRFLSYLYAVALLCVAILPGIPARLSVVTGLMLTFWYTQHLKPRTWLKNAVCASLIALSPLTSGLAAMAQASTMNPTSVLNVGDLSPMIRVVTMLFVGIMGREMTMDINDVEDDRNHGVRTVPVVYGQKFASGIGLTCSLSVAGIALGGPLLELWSLQGNVAMGTIRRLVLASLGSLAQLRRSIQVFISEGQDSTIVSKAVDEGLLSVVLLLASFV